MLLPAKDLSSRFGAPPGNPSDLEFLVVCDNYLVFQTVAGAIRQVDGRLNCTPNTVTARDYVARRKVDGIIIDMTLPGALELISHVRAGSPNRFSVVFACMGSSPETQFAIRAGANFVLHRPLLTEKLAHVFTVATNMMMAEKRRYFRYPLMVPVELTVQERQVESTMSNLSEGGMAIWSLYYHTLGSPMEFAFEIPFGGLIIGNGQVAWTNADGLTGVKFNLLPEEAFRHLSGWIARRDIAGGI